ncbi:oxidation resistance protein 1 [Tripterygium wilfordii]|uniref:Oxidation resistance protein 1 n=1 Tax=Tripterygium wilfordii TaxID=458696 RepID=A0A7J7E194_TRIWF|nr:oxidation resistance protein 1 [Tripterygium wilfordii]
MRVPAFISELLAVVPNAHYYKRGTYDLKKIVGYANNKDFSAVIVVHTNRTEPDALLVIGLPNGPTVHFKLSNLVLRKDIKNHGNPTGHKPELVMNNFTTRLGHRLGRLIMSLFPQDPNFHGRYIFETKETKQSDSKGTAKKAKDAKGENVTDQRTIARLQECGPRFTLKLISLISLQHGTFDTKGGEYELVHKARPYYKRVFSLVAPFDWSKSRKHQDTLIPIQSLPDVPVRWRSKECRQRDEQFNSYQEGSATRDNGAAQKSCEVYKDYSPVSVCENKQTLSPRDNHEDRDSQRSSNDSDVLEEASEQQSPQKSLPNFTDDSAFISQDLYEFLKSSLPNIVMGRQWVLLYSTSKHGISLRTLIRKSADLSGPCLLIAGDMGGAIFGGLLDCPLKPTAKRKYQGTHQTFIFTTLYGAPRIFRPTGVNRYYYMCLNDLLALGGGGNFALCLDGDLLSGTSGPCETFGNLCLAHSPEFELKNVELWGFAHASGYLT